MHFPLILSSVFLLNCFQSLSLLSAFQTTSHSSTHGCFVPQKNRDEVSSPGMATTTSAFRRPPWATTAFASSNDDETFSRLPSENIEKAEDTGKSDPSEPSNNNNTANQANPQTTQPRVAQRGPTADDLMLMMGTNPRRIALGTISATGIALAGNFLGVTSRLLTTVPEERVEAIGIDAYFPRGDYKRCQTPEYTFVLPKEWVADTFVELAKAQRKVQPLDYSMQQDQRSRKITTLPDSAYGPPGRLNQKGVSQQGDTNVSVIVSSGLSGFTLEGTLGTPRDAAETLLSKSIAPEGSGRVATLQRAVEDRGGQTYQFEYVVDRGARAPPLKNIAVIAASPAGDKLYTLTVVAPAEKWKDGEYDAKLRKIADTFHLR